MGLDIGWFLIVVGGMVLLGCFIAYGMMRNAQRTPSEKSASERATHTLYKQEDRAPGP